MRARLSSWFDGAGWFVGIAAALFLFTLLAAGLVAQSASVLLWTGHQVAGSEQGGIVFYRWHGQSYSADVPGYGSARSVSVYLDPADPARAAVDSVGARAPAVLLVGIPGVVGAILLAAGPVRNQRQARRRARGIGPPAGFGQGLEQEFVARRLDELRHGHRPRP